MLIFNNNELKIKKRRKKTQIKNEYLIFKHIFKKYKKIPIFRIFGYKKKKIWLLNDRKDAAMDNGEAMFRYLSKNKDIKKYVYFAIDKNTKDWKYLKKYGKVVKHGSLKHKILYMKAKYIISSHTTASFYKPFTDNEDVMYNDLHEHKLVFLQHGIIINEVSKALNKYNRNVDLFITSTAKEQAFIQEERYMYKKNEVVLTGLPRYDYLNSDHEKTIIIIPTWRTYLNFGKTAAGYEKFTKTKFYQHYKLILESKKLRKHIKKNNYKIKFLLHQEMKSYASSFKQFENDQIKVLMPGEESYKSLVSRASLFITDYSSISFDFAYLLKPIIYYQFDKVDFFDYHYSKGYFDYEKDGFGRVINESEKLINYIIHSIDNKCKMNDEYINKTKETFKYIDKNNCERVYNEITKI